jgi:hypothetical protein
MWKAKPSVRDSWKKVFNNLTGCRRSLKQWVRKQARPIEEQIQKKEEELRSLQLADLPDLPTLEAPIMNAYARFNGTGGSQMEAENQGKLATIR